MLTFDDSGVEFFLQVMDQTRWQAFDDLRWIKKYVNCDGINKEGTRLC